MLCVIPNGSDRVAVEITHDHSRAMAELARRVRGCGLAGPFREPIDQTSVVGTLLIWIIRARVAEQQARTVEAEWLRRVEIARYQSIGQTIHRGGACSSYKHRFSRRIGSAGVRGKVV